MVVINRDMSTSSSNGTGGTETLEPSSCPPCLMFRKGEGLQESPTRLSEPKISLLRIVPPLHLEP